MPTDCYETACEHATNEIDEISAQIERLTRRKELLEKLLEPLKLLVRESGSVAAPITVSDRSNNEFPVTKEAPQASPIVVLVGVPEPEPGPLETPAPIMQVEVEETNGRARRNSRSISHQDVAELAYHLWNKGGQVHGRHEEDWFRAAHELQMSVLHA
jgi:hypothetical protein